MGGDGDSGDATPPAATAPTSVAAPVAVAPATLGGAVRAGADTPKDVVAALKGDDVVVVAFLNGKAADDQKVAKAVRDAQADAVVSDGARFFVYTLGKKRFGDLADLLGVEGTPSVAVIGRDRNLANLFTGLIDGDILRQAIWDAGDTPAAHVGASSAGGTGAATPTGDKAGIALARKVQAAYADVPGVAVEGSVEERGTAFSIDAEMALAKGNVTRFDGTLTLGGTGFEMIGTTQTFHIRSTGAPCWAAVPVGQAVPEQLSNPAIPLDGTRFAAPRDAGGVILLDATQGSATVTYAIDAATHRVKEVRAGALGTVTFRTLDTAPSVETPSPVCENPAQALDAKALKAFAGGTVS
jgi:hypothetical protein